MLMTQLLYDAAHKILPHKKKKKRKTNKQATIITGYAPI
jgi:hypothetical protein